MKIDRLQLLGAIVLPIILFLVSPMWSSVFNSKKIEYLVSSKTSFGQSTFNKKEWPDLAITYKGQETVSGTFVTVVISNEGGAPIKKEDYETPLTIHLAKPNIVVAQRVSNKSPENIPISMSSGPEAVVIDPVLLNPGDKFTVELFGTDDFDVTSVDARISGVNEVTRAPARKVSGVIIGSALPNGIGHSDVWAIYTIPKPVLIFAALMFWVAYHMIGEYAERYLGARKYCVIGISYLLYSVSCISILVMAYELQHEGVSKLWSTVAMVAVFMGLLVLSSILHAFVSVTDQKNS